MNEQELIKQLKQADRAAGVPNLVSLDIDSLGRQVQRHQALRRVLSVAAGLILVLGWWTLRPVRDSAVTPTPSPLQATADQWAALQAGTRQLERLLDVVEQRRELKQKERQVDAEVVAITAPLREALSQADLVAGDMVAEAQRLMQQRRRRDAIKRYQRVIELFPQSPWAQVADQQLQEIQPNEKSTQLKGDFLCPDATLSC